MDKHQYEHGQDNNTLPLCLCSIVKIKYLILYANCQEKTASSPPESIPLIQTWTRIQKAHFVHSDTSNSASSSFMKKKTVGDYELGEKLGTGTFGKVSFSTCLSK